MSAPSPGRGGPCPRCGIDQGGMLPADAVATIRSLPRRWRPVLAVLQEDDHAEVDDGWGTDGEGDGAGATGGEDAGTDRDGVVHEGVVRAVLAGADDVRSRLDALAEAVRRIRVRDLPDLPVAGDAAGTSGPSLDDPDRILDALTRAAREASDELDRLEGADWERRGRRDDTDVSVLDLARDAAHHGVHELRVADADLRAARGR